MSRLVQGSRPRGQVQLVVGLLGTIASAIGSLSPTLGWLGVGGALPAAIALIWAWWLSQAVEVEVSADDFERTSTGMRFTVEDRLARRRRNVQAFERVPGGMQDVGVVTGTDHAGRPYIELNTPMSLVVVVQ